MKPRDRLIWNAMGGHTLGWLFFAWHLAFRETVRRYKWSKVGFLWPTASFVIYSIAVSLVFSVIFEQTLRAYLPYLTSGMVLWIFVQSFLVEGVNLLSTYKGYIVNIRIPFQVYVLVLAFRSLILLGMQLPVVLVAKVVFNNGFMPGFFYLLPALALTSAAGLLMAGIMSYLGPIFPDLVHLIPSIATILTLITPVFYPIETLAAFPWIYEFNPMYYLVFLPREALLGNAPASSLWIGVTTVMLVLAPIYWLADKKVGAKIVPLI